MMFRFLSWPTLGVALAVLLIFSIAGGILYDKQKDDWAAPDKTAMRYYRVQKLSDADIREARAKAVLDEAKFKQQDQKQRDDAWRERAERDQKCADVVYRERNVYECNRGSMFLMFTDDRFTPTADSLFEQNILGPCYYVATRQEARAAGCLPPK